MFRIIDTVAVARHYAIIKYTQYYAIFLKNQNIRKKIKKLIRLMSLLYFSTKLMMLLAIFLYISSLFSILYNFR
jgi:hypothetical protein